MTLAVDLVHDSYLEGLARVLLQAFRGLVTRSTLGGAEPPPQGCGGAQ